MHEAPRLLSCSARAHRFAVRIAKSGESTEGRRLLAACRLAIFGLAAAYFGTGLGAREVSVLESQDLGIARDLFKSFGLSPDHSPLHFVLLDFWQRLNSTSVAFLRAPSVLFSAVSAVIVFSLARRVAGTLSGLLAALFFTLNPAVVDAARSMRLYSLMLMSATACLWFAHGYVTRSWQRKYLLGFVASAVLAVYTHLFSWLLVGSIALVLSFDLSCHWTQAVTRRQALKCYGALSLLLLPQILHGLIAADFVAGRHALYHGLSSHFSGFFLPILRTLFIGESEASVPIGNYALLPPLLLALLGVFALRKTGVQIAASLFAAPLALTWLLTRTSEVEPRYLIFLAPSIATFMGVGAVLTPKARYWVPVVVTTLWIFDFSTNCAYSAPPTDWYEGGQRVAALSDKGDVVAVFPGYWLATFLRYTDAAPLVPVTLPVDLDRVLNRGKRVLLVVNGGRYFGNIESYLEKNAKFAEVFRTQGSDPMRVYSISPRRLPRSPARNRDSIVLVGLVGSGGFHWQEPAEPFSPLARLSPMLRDSRVAMFEYEPYHLTWAARLLVGGKQAALLAPNTSVIRTLKDAGFGAAVVACSEGDCASDASLLRDSGLRVVGEQADPTIVGQDGTKSVMVALNSATDLGKPGPVPDASLSRLRQARVAVGATGRVIVFIPVERDYGRLATASDRATAEQLIDAGADFVVGTGGYAAKELEEYKNGVIAYSLGTLLRPSTMSLAMRESTGIALRLNLSANSSRRYEVIPLTFDDTTVAGFGDPREAKKAISTASGARCSLTDLLSSAHASFLSTSGEPHRLNDFNSRGYCL